MHHSEHMHQVSLINWFDIQYPQYAQRLFAIPNGGHRHVAVAAKMKKEGVRAGVPDCFLPVPANGYHGLFIEMKKPDGRTSATQKDWIKYLNSQGYLAEVAFGFEDAKTIVTNYLK